MNILKFEDYLNHLFDPLFNFAFALIPEQLQASQICLDSFSALLLENKPLIRKFIESSEVSSQVEDVLYKYVFNLAKKREFHLSSMEGDLGNNRDFYNLDIVQRGVLFLREKTPLSLSRIESIVDLRNYQIINIFEVAKNKLNKPMVQTI